MIYSGKYFLLFWWIIYIWRHWLFLELFLIILPTQFSHHFPIYSSGYTITVLRRVRILIPAQLDFNMVAFYSHCTSLIHPEQQRFFMFAWSDGVNFTLLLGISQTLHFEMGFLCADLALHLCLNADVCKRGDVTVKPSHVISLGSAVNISCFLKPKQGCSQDSSFNRLILYKFNRRIQLQDGHSLSSQVSGLPLGTTLFVCKLACSSSKEIRICGAEISVGGEHSIWNF